MKYINIYHLIDDILRKTKMNDDISLSYFLALYDINNTNYFNTIQSLTNESISLRRNIIKNFKAHLNCL